MHPNGAPHRAWATALVRALLVPTNRAVARRPTILPGVMHPGRHECPEASACQACDLRLHDAHEELYRDVRSP